jgi:hypothetical protein
VLKFYFAGIISVRSTPLYKKEKSGSVPWTNGTGSGRQKNMRILRSGIPAMVTTSKYGILRIRKSKSIIFLSRTVPGSIFVAEGAWHDQQSLYFGLQNEKELTEFTFAVHMYSF